MTEILPQQSLKQTTAPSRSEKSLRNVAVELEATFLAEMLKSAGLGKGRDSFGGGAGEDQFNSFLVRAQATQMAQAGGIGLSEFLFNALMEAQND